MPNMGRTIEAFIDEDLRDEVQIMVGGAPVTQEFADDMGADGYGKDALACVALAKQLIAGCAGLRCCGRELPTTLPIASGASARPRRRYASRERQVVSQTDHQTRRQDHLNPVGYDRSRIEEFKHDLDLYGFVVVEDLITASDADRLACLLESLIR